MFEKLHEPIKFRNSPLSAIFLFWLFFKALFVLLVLSFGYFACDTIMWSTGIVLLCLLFSDIVAWRGIREQERRTNEHESS